MYSSSSTAANGEDVVCSLALPTLFPLETDLTHSAFFCSHLRWLRVSHWQGGRSPTCILFGLFRKIMVIIAQVPIFPKASLKAHEVGKIDLNKVALSVMVVLVEL